MPSGGARNRSGPPPDPSSGRSDRRGLTLTALPAQGYRDEAPEFPLPGATDRELEVWTLLWRTPQACAWARQSWRWLNLADLVRLQVRGEARDASVAIATAVRQLRADFGLTPAGLIENGWAIAPDETAAKRAEKAPARKASSRDRMKVVPGAAAGA